MGFISFQLPQRFMRYVSQNKICENGRRLNAPWLVTVTLLLSSELMCNKVVAAPCLALCFEHVPLYNKGEQQAKAVLLLLTRSKRQSMARKIVGTVVLHIWARLFCQMESPLLSHLSCFLNGSLLCSLGPFMLE